MEKTSEYLFNIKYIDHDDEKECRFAGNYKNNLTDQEKTEEAKKDFYSSDACSVIPNVKEFLYVGPTGY